MVAVPVALGLINRNNKIMVGKGKHMIEDVLVKIVDAEEKKRQYERHGFKCWELGVGEFPRAPEMDETFLRVEYPQA